MSDLSMVLARLERLHPRRIDLSLHRILRLCERLGSPHLRLPKVIHVAGTNGKGSFISFMDSLLRFAGYSVSRYTSPHLVCFNERIVFNGAPISDSDLCDYLERCEAANKGDTITFFEITTAAAFLAFAERETDILLLEVGLGGEYDATNIVESRFLSVITPISEDHREFLGATIRDIASAKAGIIRGSAPVVAMACDATAESVITETARAKGSRLRLYGRDFTLSEDKALVLYGDGGVFALPCLSLLGEHQRYNAALVYGAVCVLRELGLSIDDRACYEGLGRAYWSARLEDLSGSRLGEALGDGWQIYLDGGHNVAAAYVLARQAELWAREDNKPLFVIFGMLANKDVLEFLRILSPFAAGLVAVPIESSESALAPAAIVNTARELGVDAHACENLAMAIEAVRSYAVEGRLLICGSLYLAGEVLSRYGGADEACGGGD